MATRSLVALIGSGVASIALAAAPGPGNESSIDVGPNMLVSRDGNFPHVELVVATNPKNAKNLVGGAITYTQPAGGTACRAYATVDGGSTWRPSEFAEQVEFGGGDPYVAFTPHGTAIFSALDFKKDEEGRTRGFLHVYRSEDGGLSWSGANELGYSYDHEQMTVDQTTGKYSGRIYLGVLYGPYPEYTVGVFRSEDDGRSWIGPVAAASGGGKIGINDVMPMVLSDGTLVMPYGDFDFLPDKVKLKGKISSTVWVVLSSDGGVSFGKPRKVHTAWTDLDDKPASRLGGFSSLAADSQSKEFRDRIYAAWTDSSKGRLRVLVSHSEDRGLHWSEPLAIDGSVPKDSLQYQPVVAVNKDGVVAVTWFDTRDSSDGSQYHQYVTASTDGGRTFLPAVRVSSLPSTPGGAGNLNFAVLAGKYKATPYLSVVSAASRWQSGGDYMGLAADRNGVFHPFWSDARSGTFQIYTAAVSVRAPAGAKPAGSPSPPEPSAKPAPRTKVSIDSRVELVFDPTTYEPSGKTADIPVRLRNLSKEAIYAPITLEVTGFDFPDPDMFHYPYPKIALVNSVNGKTREGAAFEFAGALGTAQALAPGALSGPVVIKIQFEDPAEPPPILFKIEGMVEEAK